MVCCYSRKTFLIYVRFCDKVKVSTIYNKDGFWAYIAKVLSSIVIATNNVIQTCNIKSAKSLRFKFHWNKVLLLISFIER